MAYIDITNEEIAAGAPITQALMTKYRDNFAAMGLQELGAPKILSVPYDVQAFTASGTWTKPSNAETGDKVMVLCIGGGASGALTTINNSCGGSGGAGGIFYYDMDDLAATVTVTVGAGANAVTSGSNVNGNDGGDTTFAAAAPLVAGGGNRGLSAGSVGAAARITIDNAEFMSQSQSGGNTSDGGYYGGGTDGGSSIFNGFGTPTVSDENASDGQFPGGGGGGVRNRSGTHTSGAGGDGWCVVFSIKEPVY